MGRFQRKIQRKHQVRSPVAVDRKMLARAGLRAVDGDSPQVRGLPPLAARLEEFAAPVLDSYKDAPAEALHPIFSFVVLAWNVGLLSRNEDDLERAIAELLGPTMRGESPTEMASMMAMIRTLVLERQRMFPDDPRMVETYSVERKPDGGYLIKASGPALVR